MSASYWQRRFDGARRVDIDASDARALSALSGAN
jgi:hypothetical protein